MYESVLEYLLQAIDKILYCKISEKKKPKTNQNCQLPPYFTFNSAIATSRSGWSIVYLFLIPARAVLMVGL